MTRMHALVVSLGAALALVLAGPALAQSGTRIGFVNVQFLLANAPQTRELESKLRDEFAPREASLVAFQGELQVKLERYQKDSSVMSEADRTSLQRELQQGDLELQRRQAALQEDFEIRQNELLGELQQTIGRRVQAFAVAQGYDLIVSNVVYASEAVDITPAVLAAISSGATATPSTSE